MQRSLKFSSIREASSSLSFLSSLPDSVILVIMIVPDSVMLVIMIIPDSVALFHRQLFRVLCVKVEKSFATRELRIMMSWTVMVMMMTLLIFIK